MPGDLKGAPVLRFCPLPRLEKAADGSLYDVMAQRYEAYKERVIKRFYTEHFSHFDRQIVLIDLFNTLNQGEAVFNDMQQALGVVMQSFAYGRTGILGRLFRPRIDRILFAATKADHVTTNQHNNLKLMLEQMVKVAMPDEVFKSIKTEFITLASVKCTETVIVDHDGHKLSCLKGILKAPYKKENSEEKNENSENEYREHIFFPGEIPPHLPTSEDWAGKHFKFISFLPPRIDAKNQSSLPHIRLDQALEFLIGDKLS